MPDRSYGSVTFWAELSAAPTSLTLTTPSGTELAALTPSLVAGTRYKATTTLSDDPRQDGRWQAVWSNASGDLLTQIFTVSPRPVNSTQLADLVLETAQRVKPIWRGVLTDGSTDTAVDPALIGVNNDVAGLFFFCLPPSGNGGLWRRVSNYGNQILAIDRPFDLTLASGDAYALLSMNPVHIEHAVRRAIHTLGQLSRLPVMSEDLTLAERDGEQVALAIPTGWASVSQVWLVDSDSETETLLRPEQWSMQPGGLIRLSQAPESPDSTSVTLVGSMDPSDPLWWDSYVDLDPALISAQASIELLLAHAGSAAIDPEDRIRKVALASQELADLRRSRRRRVLTNSRAVIR